MPVKVLLGKIATLIINPLIILGFIIATIFLFYGIVKMVWGAADSGSLETNKRNVLYGIVGLFVMFSVYGILRLALDTFGIEANWLFP